jgi:hypothetical protein
MYKTFSRKIILFFLGIFFGVGYLSAQSYKAVGGKMMTIWGEGVTPENAWSEYPRPQLKRGEWKNLNGLWEYAIVSKESPKPSEFQGEILVPFAVESALSGVGKPLLPEQKLWYRKIFEVPENWKGQNVILHFQAVDWETTVWVNGKQVGVHKGGSTAFSFDITNSLKKGKQEIIVSVWDPTDAGDQARGKQALNPHGVWYTPVSGIWQTVWLEPVNNTRVNSILPVVNIQKGQVQIDAGLSGVKGGESLDVRVLDANHVIFEKRYPATGTIVLDIPEPKLWTPESPTLYRLEVTLKRNDEVYDKVDSYFAMREVSMIEDEQGFQRIQLNNQTLFQYGVLDQGWWPDGLLTPPSAEAMRYDMEILKDMGFNMLRKHIKVEPWLYYYYADSLGILVWQDMVSGFETDKRSVQHVHWNAARDWERSSESAAQWEHELKTMIDQLKFFPSIVTWVVFNEGWGQFDTERVVDWVMKYDTTRLIDGVSGWVDRGYGHMRDIHQYPGPGIVPAEQNPGRVIVLGEFGGLGLPIEGHLWNPSMRNWGYRTYYSTGDLIKEYTKLIHNLSPLRYSGLSAAVYTQTTDVEGEVNGLITYDRKVIKIDPELLRILHYPLYGKETRTIGKIVSDSEISPRQLLFSLEKPNDDWIHGQDFTKFKKVNGPVSVAKGENIYSISSFSLDEIPGGVYLHIHAFGDVKVYLNGNLVVDKKNLSRRHYEDVNISEYIPFLRKGENILAVECGPFEQNSEFDYGLFSY